jgi:putative ABC transport system permease protein
VRRLSSLGSKSLAHRKGRSLLTGAGIVLGVAILFGVLVANATTQQGVDDLIEDFTGRADVVVNAQGFFESKLPKGTLEKVRKLPGVKDVVGDTGFGTALPEHAAVDDPEEPANVFVNGIEPAEAKKIQNYEFVKGTFAAPGKNEVIISERFAEELDLSFGDALKVRGKAATRDLRIVGILTDTGAGRAGQGTTAYTSIQTARAMSGDAPDTYGGGSVILEEGTNTDRWIADNRDAMKGVRLQNAENLASGFKDFLRAFGTFLTFFAGITLFVGAFLIYLTLSMAVIERTRMYGTLRALGATRRQVRRIVLLEGIVLGIVSALIGLVVGLALAKGLLVLIGNLFDLELPGLVITPAALVASVVVGLVVTLGSALVPAFRAGRLSPVEAMKGDFARDTKLGRAWIFGAVLFVLSVFLQLGSTGGEGDAPPVAVIGILLGTVLMVPLLLRPLATLLGKLTNRLARGVGEIAVLHLSKERSRSAYTLALVMVVMAMIFATGGLYLSIRGSVDDLVERQFGADVAVFPQTPQKASLEPKLRAHPDVAEATSLFFGQGTLIEEDPEPGEDGRDGLFVRTIVPESYFRVSSYSWADGNDDEAREALSKGGSVLVSSEIANIHDLERGDTIRLETTAGETTFKVVAVYSPQFGPPEITMGIKDARRYLGAKNPQGYLVDLREGANTNQAVDRIEAAFKDTPLEMTTSADVREQARNQVSTYFQIVYAILAIAGIVGLLGLANTLAMSVLHRFREIGILRAIGVTRSQTWRMVLVESATMGLTAFVLAIPLGFLLTALVLASTSDGFGFTLDVVYPWTWIPFVAVFGLAIAVIAAIAPGRRASKLHVVSALQYE